MICYQGATLNKPQELVHWCQMFSNLIKSETLEKYVNLHCMAIQSNILLFGLTSVIQYQYRGVDVYIKLVMRPWGTVAKFRTVFVLNKLIVYNWVEFLGKRFLSNLFSCKLGMTKRNIITENAKLDKNTRG